jgi:hypothetical protein
LITRIMMVSTDHKAPRYVVFSLHCYVVLLIPKCLRQHLICEGCKKDVWA